MSCFVSWVTLEPCSIYHKIPEVKWLGIFQYWFTEREIESCHQENLTKPRHTQISPKILFFHNDPDKGFVRVELGGGRALHELYLTYRHFWQILYKHSAGVSSTSIGVIYAFITPNPASKSCHSHTSFSMQTFQINFLSFYSDHKKLTPLAGFPLPCWFRHSCIRDVHLFFGVCIPAAQFATVSLSLVGWAFHIQSVSLLQSLFHSIIQERVSLKREHSCWLNM